MEREKLIEEIGVHFESVYNLPPLAARIYAILIMGNEEGYSFEALVEEVAASKSTVSTSLNLLLQLQKLSISPKRVTENDILEKNQLPKNQACKLYHYLRG